MEKNDILLLQKFGERVATFRARRNLSQRQLSDLCGIDHGNISRIENGKLNVTLTTMAQLASALGVAPKRLVDFEMD